MSGLLAARVLSDHFQRVTLIERDQYPAQAGENRKGVPQGRHTHGLLASGARVLERFFPGLSTTLQQCGAVCCDIVRDGYWFQEGAPLAEFPSEFQGVIASRPLLEGKVRERVKALSNLEIIENTVVEHLVTEKDGNIAGVRTGGGFLEADLVVDASGRGSHAGHWLQDLGFEAPREERVEIALGYATRLFRRRPGDMGGRMAAVVPPTPDGKRGGVALAQEGDRWTVTLISHFQASPPLDLEGFREFAKGLHAPYLYEIVKDAEPIGEGIPARMPASVRRHYEELSRFPEGFLVFGDAICSFNPIYGQGMSAAALEAVALDDELRSVRTNKPLYLRFFAAASRLVDIPWSIAVGNDLRMPETTGKRTPAVRFINWYVSKLHRAGHRDIACSLAFHRVANLMAPPESLMRPSIVWKVFRGNLSRSVSRPQSNKRTTGLAAEPHCASSPLDPSKSLSDR
jgi:flavin-dependent dehydrogenase